MHVVPPRPFRRAAAIAAGALFVLSAGAQPLSESTVRAMEKVLRDLPRVQAGAVVADANTGQVLFEFEGDRPLKPASVQKLFTTATALERWGTNFAFDTRVYLKDSDLWIIGGGDPSLGDERLAQRDGRAIDHVFDEWAAALRARGVDHVRRIVLDDSIFDQQLRHPDWPDDQSDRWYQAPVGGLNLNDNCLDVTIGLDGRKVDLKLQPPLPPSWVENQMGVGKRHSPAARRSPQRDVFELRGTVTRGGPLESMAVRRPTAFFGAALKTALEQRGIRVEGEPVRRTDEMGDGAGAVLIATHQTPLADVLWRCNTFSQNLFAECLIKALGAYGPDGRRTGIAGSWDLGRQIIVESLGRLGVDLRDARLRDGCGLSAENRVTPRSIVRLLVAMRRHPASQAFLASLARAGEDGSMKHRYGDPVFRGKLIGKTGTIKGVTALAGYATQPDGRVLAFAIQLNGEADVRPIVTLCKLMVAPTN